MHIFICIVYLSTLQIIIQGLSCLLRPECMLLFAVQYAWQMPHFMTIAYIYRHDYQNAGYIMRSNNNIDIANGQYTAIHGLKWLSFMSLLPFLAWYIYQFPYLYVYVYTHIHHTKY